MCIKFILILLPVLLILGEYALPYREKAEGRRPALCWWPVFSVFLFICVILYKIIECGFVNHLTFERKHKCDCSLKFVGERY